jgi:ketosteroid isomerase-like protein
LTFERPEIGTGRSNFAGYGLRHPGTSRCLAATRARPVNREAIVESISLEDRVDIRDLVERYGHAITRRDWDAVAECYAEDATFYELPPVEVRMAGRDEIVSRTREILEKTKCMVMMMHGSVIDLKDGKVKVGTLLHEFGRTLDDSADIILYGFYDDEVVKQDGRWRFQNRVFGPIHTQLPDNLTQQLLE